MPHTQNWKLSYPLASDAPAGSDQLQILATDTDAALTQVNDGAAHSGGITNNRIAALETEVSALDNKVAALEHQIAYQWPITYRIAMHLWNTYAFHEGDWISLHITGLTAFGRPLGYVPDCWLSGYGGYKGSFYLRRYLYGATTDSVKIAIICTNTFIVSPNDKVYYTDMLITNPSIRSGSRSMNPSEHHRTAPVDEPLDTDGWDTNDPPIAEFTGSPDASGFMDIVLPQPPASTP